MADSAADIESHSVVKGAGTGNASLSRFCKVSAKFTVRTNKTDRTRMCSWDQQPGAHLKLAATESDIDLLVLGADSGLS